jgi:hypothetical protein
MIDFVFSLLLLICIVGFISVLIAFMGDFLVILFLIFIIGCLTSLMTFVMDEIRYDIRCDFFKNDD